MPTECPYPGDPYIQLSILNSSPPPFRKNVGQPPKMLYIASPVSQHGVAKYVPVWDCLMEAELINWNPMDDVIFWTIENGSLPPRTTVLSPAMERRAFTRGDFYSNRPGDIVNDTKPRVYNVTIRAKEVVLVPYWERITDKAVQFVEYPNLDLTSTYAVEEVGGVWGVRLPSGIVGMPYGPYTPFTKLYDGVYPTGPASFIPYSDIGLSIDASGVISGVPTTAGDYSFGFAVKATFPTEGFYPADPTPGYVEALGGAYIKILSP